jgi:hypothetical protein
LLSDINELVLSICRVVLEFDLAESLRQLSGDEAGVEVRAHVLGPGKFSVRKVRRIVGADAASVKKRKLHFLP